MDAEQMRKMAANMSPEMMQQAQDMMRNMSSEQMASMSNMARNMGMPAPPPGAPMPTAADFNSAQSRMSAQNKYTHDASMALKTEGTALFKAGSFRAALEKYERGRKNLQGLTAPDAVELCSLCTLNVAMCRLKLSEWAECADACTAVLAQSPANVKALYRRGQAYIGLRRWAEAVDDLQRAAQLAAQDPAQQALINGHLETARRSMGAGTSGAAPDAASSGAGARTGSADRAAPAPASSTQYQDGDVIIEDVTDQVETIPPPAAASSAPARTGGAAPVPGGGANHADMVRQMLESDPASLQRVAGMMDNMTDAQFEEIGRLAGQQGMPMDRNMAKQASSMMKGMTSEQLKSMAQVASSMQGVGMPAGGPAAALRSPVAASRGAVAAPVALPQMPAGMDMSGMADMLGAMSPDQLRDMTKASGMPAGMDMSPEMMKASLEMMKGMTSEDMANMQRMAGQLQGTPSPGGGPPKMDMAAAANMMKDPKAMESAMKMMTGMDEASLTNMLKMSQPGMTDEAARKAAHQMKSLDEKSMATMMKLAGGVQRAMVGWQSAREWLVARPGVMFALAFLLVALLLRWFGVV